MIDSSLAYSSDHEIKIACQEECRMPRGSVGYITASYQDMVYGVLCMLKDRASNW